MSQQLTFPTYITANSLEYATSAWPELATASTNPASLLHTRGPIDCCSMGYLLIAQAEQEDASSVTGAVGLLYYGNDQLALGQEIIPFAPPFDNDIQLPVHQMSYQ